VVLGRPLVVVKVLEARLALAPVAVGYGIRVALVHAARKFTSLCPKALEGRFSLGYGLRHVDSVVGSLAIFAKLLVGSACHLDDFEPSDVAGRGAEALEGGISYSNGRGFHDLVTGSLAIFAELLVRRSCHLLDTGSDSSFLLLLNDSQGLKFLSVLLSLLGSGSSGLGLSSSGFGLSSSDLLVSGSLSFSSSSGLSFSFSRTRIASEAPEDGSSVSNGACMIDNVVGFLATISELLVGSSCHLDDRLFGVAAEV